MLVALGDEQISFGLEGCTLLRMVGFRRDSDGALLEADGVVSLYAK